jgi:iron complex outermembrane receptor protein
VGETEWRRFAPVPAPVTVYTRADIERTGAHSVADFLRELPANIGGSFRGRSGVAFGAVSKALLDLRAVGSEHTLVLVNGRRPPGTVSPSFVSAQNLNLIPIAAVDRIEVYRDGHSARFGSGAVAGVVNIVMEEAFTDAEAGVVAGEPTRDGTPSERRAWLRMGKDSERGNLRFTVDHQARGLMLDSARDFSATGVNAYGFPASYQMFDPDDGGFQGTGYDARCPSAFGESERFPNSRVSSGLCVYNYAGTSAGISAGLARDSLVIDADYRLAPATELFVRTLVTHAEGLGRYAAAPLVGNPEPVPFPTMAADHPLNPTRDASRHPGGPYDIEILYRNVPAGPRDTLVNDQWLDVTAGLRGQSTLLPNLDWEVAARHARIREHDFSFNLVSMAALQREIDAGGIDIFRMGEWDSDADYDRHIEAAARRVAHDGFTRGESVLRGLDGQAAMSLPGPGPAPMRLRLGFEYTDESQAMHVDAAVAAGDALGGVRYPGHAGRRDNMALFAELDLPLPYDLDLGLSLRHDDYSVGGSHTSPGIELAWRTTSWLSFHAAWSENFRVASFSQLFEPGTHAPPGSIDWFGDNFGLAHDRLACDIHDGVIDFGPAAELDFPEEVCNITGYPSATGGNRALDPETAIHRVLGASLSPYPGLVFTANHYRIEIDDRIVTPGMQFTFNRERENYVATGGACWPNCVDPGRPGSQWRIERGAEGDVTRVFRGYSNLGRLETEGYDLEALWGFSLAPLGDFRLHAEYSRMRKWEQSVAGGSGFIGGPTLQAPDKRIRLGLSWGRGDWDAHLQGRHIGALSDTWGNRRLASWTVWDLQGSWESPWRGRVTVGVRNLTDRDPPTDTQLGHPYFLHVLHDPYGRMPYLAYTQRF